MPPALPFKAKVVVSWAGEEEGDLGFLENEVVEVYLFVDDSWWSGNCVEMVPRVSFQRNMLR